MLPPVLIAKVVITQVVGVALVNEELDDLRLRQTFGSRMLTYELNQWLEIDESA